MRPTELLLTQELMNQKLISSLTVSLLIATLSASLASTAKSSEITQKDAEAQATSTGVKPTSDQASTPSRLPESTIAKLGSPRNEVEKVGEQQVKPSNVSPKTIAKVYSHNVSGRKAATLYVRNIPVLTFIGEEVSATETSSKMGTQAAEQPSRVSSAQTKALRSEAASESSSSSLLESSNVLAQSSSTPFTLNSVDVGASEKVSESDPVWKATTVAAKLNQLYSENTDSESITVSWDNNASGAGGDRYLIRANKIEIAAIDRATILPDTTNNLEQDALQATNRLRRLMGTGNTAPLQEVAGKPGFSQHISLGSVLQRSLTGFASWYGPGFHGNRSASGEVFNQYAMTAAHRTLPFGTRVVVTNLDNGQSVVVRINDRGPYHGNRIIDLSAAAARVLGLMQSGVAPVRIEVLADGSPIAGN